MTTRKRSSIVSSAKAFERKLASMVGGRRIPSTGLLHEIDVESSDLAIQAKKGQRLPAYLNLWLEGIRGSAGMQAAGKLPMVVWNTWGADARDSVVVIHFGDFLAWRAGEGKSELTSDLMAKLAASQARVRLLTQALGGILEVANRAVENTEKRSSSPTSTEEGAVDDSQV